MVMINLELVGILGFVILFITVIREVRKSKQDITETLGTYFLGRAKTKDISNDSDYKQDLKRIEKEVHNNADKISKCTRNHKNLENKFDTNFNDIKTRQEYSEASIIRTEIMILCSNNKNYQNDSLIKHLASEYFERGHNDYTLDFINNHIEHPISMAEIKNKR